MPKKFVDEVDRRILEMLEQKKLRRQAGGLSLADTILNKVPKVPKLPKIKEIR